MASESISCVSSGTAADESLNVSVDKENAKESIDNQEGGNTDCKHYLYLTKHTIMDNFS